MKKITVLALAVLLNISFAVSVLAIESKFGGYWRTRAFTQQNFTGEDRLEGKNLTRVDTRTRLYYTAIINDDLKFVNKFEFDAVWGESSSYGDIGADGINVEIKNSYADFNKDDFNIKMGVQGTVLGRGFLFDDDFAGAVVTYKDDDITIPFLWMKAYEGGSGKDENDKDVDYYVVNPSFTMDDNQIKVSPLFMYVTSDDVSAFGSLGVYKDLDLFYFGFDLDAKYDDTSFWFTGIYALGSADYTTTGDADISAWMAAAGFVYDCGDAGDIDAVDIHGQFFYATGDDDATDNDIEAYFGSPGNSYYWSEIMGKGIFDNQVSNNSPGDGISNIFAINLGTRLVVDDDLSIEFDIWHAKLNEEVLTSSGENEDALGTEVNIKVTYEFVEKLNVDFIVAYLFAGDATTDNSSNDANPYEIGTRFSFKF